MALEAGVDPVVVLTKADQAADPEGYRERALTVMADLPVDVINTLDINSLKQITAWITDGSTVALVGSSGVGKSTIVNSLAGTELTQTGDIRDLDSKGHHTTSHRELHLIPNGGLLINVPGMREESGNTASLAEQRRRGRQLSKTIRQHTDLKRRRRI